MAQWTQTLEPYIKVQEKIKTAAINPTAGESLIVGATIISDAGPSNPTLITSQSEFLATYASRDLTEDYVKSLDALYGDGNDTIASTMWLNAYRLAGSGSLLITRAFKGDNLFFAKPLVASDSNTYILKDGNILKKVNSFKLVVDIDSDDATHSTDGWSIAISGVGVLGNRTTDDGAQYDYYVQNLQELVEFLNDSPVFFSPSFTFYSDEAGTEGNEIEVNTDGTVTEAAVSVIFDEVYIGANILDLEDTRCTNGYSYVIACEPDWTTENLNQKLVDLSSWSSFEDVPYYATNTYNSNTDLLVRIRRFNHDAVVTKELSENSAFAGGDSPYTVLTSVLDTYYSSSKYVDGTLPESITDRDFYEFAVLDPSVSGQPEYYNVGNIYGRGDMTEAELNDLLNMISLQLPDNLADLGLDYYGYIPSDQRAGWAILSNPTTGQKEIAVEYASRAALEEATGVSGSIAVVGRSSYQYYAYSSGSWVSTDPVDDSGVNYVATNLSALVSSVKIATEGDIAKIGTESAGSYYTWKTGMTASDVDPEEIYIDLSIDPSKYKILNVSDTDLLKAMDKIDADEVYTVEGLTDLGNTQPIFQTYLANMAVNTNYFYPISTVNSTNYLAIANSAARISKDSYKLYLSAPWDVDTGTVGFKFYSSPSVLYWEAVNRNRGLGREFADLFGQMNGIVQYQRPTTEFNKKTRQLLLSKKINTVLWNTQSNAWNMNDNYTKQSEDNIMASEANSRLGIRIAKAMPILLRQFIGQKINDILYANAESVINYYFTNTILPMNPYSISSWRVTIPTINTDEDRRANRMKVLVEVRFQRALKYVIVYENYFDVGMEFDGQI